MCGNRPIIKLCVLNNLMVFPIFLYVFRSDWFMFLFLFNSFIYRFSLLTIETETKSRHIIAFASQENIWMLAIRFNSLSRPILLLLSSLSSHILRCACACERAITVLRLIFISNLELKQLPQIFHLQFVCIFYSVSLFIRSVFSL